MQTHDQDWILRHISQDEDETSSSQKLTDYFSVESPTEGKTFHLLEQIRFEQRMVSNTKKTTLLELGKHDHKIQGYLIKCTDLARDLEEKTSEVHGDDIFSTVKEIINQYVDDGYTQEQLSYVSRIRSARKNETSIRTAIYEFVTLLKNDQVIWRDVLSKYEVPNEIVDDIDRVQKHVELRVALLELDKVIKSDVQWSKDELVKVRAQILKEHGRNLFHNDVLLDLIEGRINIDDPYVYGNFVDGYYQLIDDVHRMKSLIFAHGRLALTIATGVLATSLLGAGLSSDHQRGIFEQRASEVQNIDNTQGLDQHERLSFRSDEKNSSSKENGTEKKQNGKEDVRQPNDYSQGISPENSGDLGKGEYWEITGNIPDSYFREYAAENFLTTPKWNSLMSNEYQIKLNKSILTETTITSKFLVKAIGHYSLPVPIGYEVVSVKLEGVSDSAYSVHRTETGTFFLNLSEKIDVGKKIVVGFSKIKEERMEYPGYGDQSTEFLIGDPKLLPPDVKSHLDSIKDSQKTDEEKALMVKNYVKEMFTYSLDPKYSDYYQNVKGKGEYVRRALELKRGDCDVVNTINTAFLRYVGLHARMGYGYANGQALFEKNSKILEEAESHGWSEFFNIRTRKWEVSDATPDKVDEYTAEKLKGHNGGSGIIDIIRLGNIEELKQALLLLFSGFNDIRINSQGAIDVCLVLGATFLAYGVPIIFEKYAVRKIEKLKWRVQEINSTNPLEHLLNQRIYSIVDRYVKSKISTLLGTETFIDNTLTSLNALLVLPAWGKMMLDFGTLKKIEKIKPDDTLRFDSKLESFPDFMNRIFGIDAEKLKTQTKAEHRVSELRGISKDFMFFVNMKFKDLFDYENFDRVLDISNQAKNSGTEKEFIRIIVDRTYKEYLRSFQKEQEQKRKKSEKENVGFQQENPISQADFLQKISGEIPNLLLYWRLMKK